MIEKIIFGIRKRQDELRSESFDARIPSPELYAQNYWKVRGLQEAMDIINILLRDEKQYEQDE